MTDDELEHLLRGLPSPELPGKWREEILANASREGRASRRAWPPLLVSLQNLCARNPFTAGALTALWILIFLLKANTPVDLEEKAMMAQFDPIRPVYLVSLADEVRLAELLQEPPPNRQLP
jgi:hypothetical protein